jgi:hypothetical protein
MLIAAYVTASGDGKGDSLTIPADLGSELSDAELLRRAVTYSRPNGFEVVEKWRAIASLLGVSETVARSLCKRFRVDPDEPAAR